MNIPTLFIIAVSFFSGLSTRSSILKVPPSFRQCISTYDWNGCKQEAVSSTQEEVWCCTTDADCPDGCCHANKVHGAKSSCYQFQNNSQACHLPNHNHTFLLYPCGCRQGLTCDEIHFTPGLGGDPVHQAELLLLGHGYGICTDNPGQLFG